MSGFALLLFLCTCTGGSEACGSSEETDSAAPGRAEAASAAAGPSKSSESRFSVGVGVKLFTLGIGGELAVPRSHRSIVRFGFDLFNYSRTFIKDGVPTRARLTCALSKRPMTFSRWGSFV